MIKKIITHRERRIVFNNFVFLTTPQGINYILPIIVLPYLIRVIGIEKFGLIAFAQSLVQYFMIITDYGFSLSATKKISLCKERSKEISLIFSSVMTVKLILVAISFLILSALLFFVPRFRQDWLVYFLSFGAVTGNTLFPTWFFQGREKTSHITLINASCAIAYALCIFIFIKGPQNFLLVPLFNSLLFFISGIWGLYVAFSRFNLKFVFQKFSDIKNELKDGWDIFVSTIAVNAYTNTRVFAVGLLTNNIITGYFSLASMIANVIQTFPMTSFTQAVYPRINNVFAKNKKRALAIMRRIQLGITLGFVVSLPIAYFISPLIIQIVCGAPYPEAVLALRILLAAVFFVGANNFKVQFLLVCGKTNLYAKIHITAALVGLPLIFLFIWRLSYVGAALATVITEASVFLLTALAIKQLRKEISN